MIIKNITIENFRSYYGVKSMDIGDGLTLIIGANGDGKTTFFEALEWLFDTTIEKYDEKCISKKKAAELEPQESANVRVSMTYINDGSERTVMKSFKFTKNLNGDISVSNYCHDLYIQNGVEKEIKEGYQACRIFDRDFSDSIRKYCLFKGEHDLNIFNKPEAMSVLIETFSQLKNFDPYLSFMSEAKRKAENALDNAIKADKKNSKHAQELRSLIKNEEDTINKDKEDLKSKQSEASKFQSLIEGAEQNHEASSTLVSLNERLAEIEGSLKPCILTIADIAEVIERWTKIPVTKITEAETEKLLNLEKNLHKHVISQDQAVTAVAKAIRRNRAGLQSTKRPPSFIFVGPTGVGKTELAKALAYEMFGSEDSIIRIDMSEFMESHSTSKLIGSPPGYVGYDDAGQLTEKVKRRPYSILLFDEIEKAHPDVFNILLQVLDDGKLTDAQGNTVSFENTIIIMTSNAGSNLNNNSIGFGNQTLMNKDKILNALKDLFRPEFLNRVDEIIAFNALTKNKLLQIVDLLLAKTQEALSNKEIYLSLNEEAKQYIVKNGTDLKYGARPLRRAIQKLVEDEIAEMLLRGEVTSGQTIYGYIENEKLKFNV